MEKIKEFINELKTKESSGVILAKRLRISGARWSYILAGKRPINADIICRGMVAYPELIKLGLDAINEMYADLKTKR